MGKKYYCDYCDKSFSDNPTNRKNHFRGVHHRQAQSAHYYLFKDAETRLREDSSKKPCKTLMNQGSCPFGAQCRFSHLTYENKQQLQKEVAAAQESRKRKQEASNKTALDFDLDVWVAKKIKSSHSSENNTDQLQEGAMQEDPHTGAQNGGQAFSQPDTESQNGAQAFPQYKIPDLFLNPNMLLLNGMLPNLTQAQHNLNQSQPVNSHQGMSAGVLSQAGNSLMTSQYASMLPPYLLPVNSHQGMSAGMLSQAGNSLMTSQYASMLPPSLLPVNSHQGMSAGVSSQAGNSLMTSQYASMLPPSLIPPTPQCFENSISVGWGPS